MDTIGEKISAVVAAIIGLAVLAVIVSSRANSANVIGAFFSGMSNLIGVAVSPVTGQAVSGLSAGGLTGGAWAQGGSGGSGTSGFSIGLGGGSGGSGSVNLGQLAGIANSAGSGIGNWASGLGSGGGDSFVSGASNLGTDTSLWSGAGDTGAITSDLAAAGW